VFDSYLHIVLTSILTTAILVGCVLRRWPTRVATHFLDQLFTRKYLLLHFIASAAVLVVNKLELKLEETYLITKSNFTSSLYQFEGHLTGILQYILKNDFLTYFLTYFYIIVFPSIIVASLLIYVYQNNEVMTKAFFYTIMLNYAIALPFFLFFPVEEVWVYHSQVNFLIPEVYPGFEQEYRPLSGINNCVPSLHTSLSLSMAMLAMYSTLHLWKWITGVSALLIIFSTNYLGIHWYFDIILGFGLAVLSSSAAIVISRGSVEVFTYSSSLQRNKK
jgi:membrane-associated phospholipid phosphatase